MIRRALISYREVKSQEGALSSEGRRLCSGSLKGCHHIGSHRLLFTMAFSVKNN